MIRINQIKLPIDHKEAALEKKIKKALHNTEYKQYKIVKRSIDARKKEELSYVYAVDVTLGKGQEEKFLKKNKNRNIMAVKEKKFEFPENQREFKYPPVVIGMGPAGEEIRSLGGDVRFEAKVTDFVIQDGKLTGLIINDKEEIKTEAAILAPGHSARDTFKVLSDRDLEMNPKAFAIGLRVEHPREMIDHSQYGKGADQYDLPAASYKLTYHANNGRSVYSFCMCPGGFVVNASSEPERLTVNGMSNHDRAAKNSNSAIIASVTPEDFDGNDALAGVRFQQKWEEKAFSEGKGRIPVQTLKDFREGKITESFGEITPNTKGLTSFGNLRNCLPEPVSEAISEGMEYFDTKIKGFNREDTILCGIEARTSSPLRIERDQGFESNIKGIYPCGEGAGFAGGITSAAMDGIKVAQALVTV